MRERASRLGSIGWLGNPGDAAPVGEAVSELRIHYSPGYRVYFKVSAREVIVLLAGGHKGTQARDIKTALRLAQLECALAALKVTKARTKSRDSEYGWRAPAAPRGRD